MSHLLLTDIHGCYRTMLAMIEQHGQGRQLILLGDLIDRGPRSREVVEYAMKNKVPTVRANHDDLALAFSGHVKLGYQGKCADSYDEDVWLCNGGVQALDSWEADLSDEASALPRDVLDWFSQLPPYIIIDQPRWNGRPLLCSHTGFGLEADKGNWMAALWGRYGDDLDAFAYKDGKPYDDGYYRVFGHTRIKKPVITDTYANIDTGCAYKGYGKLTGMLWPEREIVQVDNLD